MTAFLMTFWRFRTTFRGFPKIFQNCSSEGQTNVPEHFPRNSENFRRCMKIAEDLCGTPEDVSMTHQRIYVQFKRHTWYQWNHRYLHMWGYHIYTCEDIVSFLSICYHSVYHRLLYNKNRYSPGQRKRYRNFAGHSHLRYLPICSAKLSICPQIKLISLTCECI